ncbi:hypothetical protein IE53DRAFT_64292 [Violaceomyces palustris]|uniref:Uncharacterized protein n=1 Tax=Violaceomyces palustris TaxID=1673888 RepID=A0ACD0NZ32_9BASI|nr:hypothetical protein IE53DRAFT_64292 [Violaceomyces palustris]
MRPLPKSTDSFPPPLLVTQRFPFPPLVSAWLALRLPPEPRRPFDPSFSTQNQNPFIYREKRGDRIRSFTTFVTIPFTFLITQVHPAYLASFPSSLLPPAISSPPSRLQPNLFERRGLPSSTICHPYTKSPPHPPHLHPTTPLDPDQRTKKFAP